MPRKFRQKCIFLALALPLMGLAAQPQPLHESTLAGQDAATTASAEIIANLKLRGNRLLRGQVASWDCIKVRVLVGADKNIPPSIVEADWNDASVIEAWRLLKQLGLADSKRWADVVTVLAAHPMGAGTVRQAADLARGAGVAQADLDAAKTRGEVLRQEADALAKKIAQQQIARRNPEASPFVLEHWSAVVPVNFDAASAAQLDSAREFLARAGGAGQAYQGQSITLLTEYTEPEEKAFAARLDLDARVALSLLEESGTSPQPNARVVIIQMSDRARYRLLLEGPLGLDPSAFDEGVTAYTPQGPVVVMPPLATLLEREFCTARQAARAMLHSFSTNVRLPAWANEVIPMIVADLAVPNAKGDILWRKQALASVRKGATLMQLVNSDYASAAWREQRALSESAAYLFGRRAFEENRSAFVQWTLSVKNGEDPSTAWTKSFGVAPALSMAASTRWFQTND